MSDLQRIQIVRARIESKISELIEMLDLLDGDPDLEANGDENDTGMPEGWRQSRFHSEIILEDDEDSCADEDGGDAEPSLGWTASGYMGPTFDPDREQDPAEMGEPEDGQ
jgi:hypothetical protein